MTAQRILVPLAEGFEEIEAVSIIDVLRRAELEVVVAGLTSVSVRGAHDIAIEADRLLEGLDAGTFDMLVLPGGMPGTTHLMADERVLEAVRTLHSAGRPTAAICAAPMVLAAAGIVAGVPVTSHPSVRAKLGDADVRHEPRVLASGPIVTSQGAGTAIEFALELVAQLCGRERADQIAAAMIVAPV